MSSAGASNSSTRRPRRQPPDPTGPWHSPDSAAAYTGLSRRTIYLLMKPENGELAWSQHGNRRRIAQSDLDDYMRRHRAS
jgi:excisionase family DNA binding protein